MRFSALSHHNTAIQRKNERQSTSSRQWSSHPQSGRFAASEWANICEYLVGTFHFERTGKEIMHVAEGIYQSFSLPQYSLQAGWDDWNGNYLLSESDSGDECLKDVFGHFFK